VFVVRSYVIYFVISLSRYLCLSVVLSEVIDSFRFLFLYFVCPVFISVVISSFSMYAFLSLCSYLFSSSFHCFLAMYGLCYLWLFCINFCRSFFLYVVRVFSFGISSSGSLFICRLCLSLVMYVVIYLVSCGFLYFFI